MAFIAVAVFAATFLKCASNSKTSSVGVKYVAVVETEIDAQSGASDELNQAEGYRLRGNSFYSAGKGGYWWTVSDYGMGLAYNWHMSYRNNRASEGTDNQSTGFSVRCVQD